MYCDSDQGSKIAHMLASTLVTHELAVRSPDGRPWLGMRPELASIYLAVLADAMGRHNSLSPPPTIRACTARRARWKS